MDCSPPDSSVHGIFQARILEWGCHFLLQWISPTQGSKLSLLWLLYLQADSFSLKQLGSCICIHTHTHILFKDMELNELMEDELNADGETGRTKIVAWDTVAVRRLKEEEPVVSG